MRLVHSVNSSQGCLFYRGHLIVVTCINAVIMIVVLLAALGIGLVSWMYAVAPTDGVSNTL